MAQLRLVLTTLVLVAMSALVGGCALFDTLWGGLPAEEGVSYASNDDGPLWPTMGKDKVKKAAQACGRDLTPQEAQQLAQKALQKAGGAQQLKALLEGKGKKLKLDKALGCKIKGKKKQQSNPAFALEVGIEQETTTEVEVGTLIEIPAGDNAALYISEVFEESESWASIKQVEVDGERLVHAETYVPETADWAIVDDASLPVMQEEWLLPDQESGSGLIGELQAEVTQALANPAGFASSTASIDPMYRLFIEQASDPTLDWAEAKVILDEAAEELVMVIPSVGTVMEEQALWPRTAKPFIDNGRSVVVRAPVVKVTVPDKPKPVVQVKKDVTTNKPVITAVNRTSNYREPFEYCPHQYYGVLTRFTAPLCSQWRTEQAPKVEKIESDIKKTSVSTLSKDSSAKLKNHAQIIGLRGKSNTVVLAGFKDLTVEQLTNFQREASSGAVGLPQASATYRDGADSYGPEAFPWALAIPVLCQILGTTQEFVPLPDGSITNLLSKASKFCAVYDVLTSIFSRSEPEFNLDRLKRSLTVLFTFTDPNNPTLAEVKSAIANYPLFVGENVDKDNLVNTFNTFVQELNNAIAGQSFGTELRAEDIIASAVFGIYNVVLHTPTQNQPVEGVSELQQTQANAESVLNNLVQALGAGGVLFAYAAHQAMVELNLSTNQLWEAHIPNQSFEEIRTMFTAVGKQQMDPENAAKIAVYFTSIANAALLNKQQTGSPDVPEEIRQGLAKAGFLMEMAVEAQRNPSLLISGGPGGFKVLFEVKDENLPSDPSNTIVDFHFIKIADPFLADADANAFVYGKVKPYLNKAGADQLFNELIQTANKIQQQARRITAPEVNNHVVVQIINQAETDAIWGNGSGVCDKLQNYDTNAEIMVIVEGVGIACTKNLDQPNKPNSNSICTTTPGLRPEDCQALSQNEFISKNTANNTTSTPPPGETEIFEIPTTFCSSMFVPTDGFDCNRLLSEPVPVIQ